MTNIRGDVEINRVCCHLDAPIFGVFKSTILQLMKQTKTGIWIDFKNAYVITFDEDGTHTLRHLESEVTHPATKGGSRSKTPWGPQFAPPDDTNLERAKHEEHHYFKQVLDLIAPDTEQVVIFGPAQAKLGLKKEIESIKHYGPRLRAVLTADYITQNEMVVLVRDFFLQPEAYIKTKEEPV